MSFSVQRFRVVDLHGIKTIDFPIEDNRIVLVGENGTSKSTVANLLFYFLTRQWNRLTRFRFAAIEVTLSDAELRRIDAIAPKGIAAGTRYPEAGMATVNR